jgi:hypothetical protein
MVVSREQGKAPKDEPQKTYFCFDTTGMYLFPREKFDKSIKDITDTSDKKGDYKKRFKLTEGSGQENFESFDPSGKNAPKTLKKREYVIYYEPKPKISKEIVICLWDRDTDTDDEFSSYIKQKEIPPHLRLCYVKLSIEGNETGKEISLSYNRYGKFQKLNEENNEESKKIGISNFFEDLRYGIRIEIEAPEKYPDIKEEKKFKIVAELFQSGSSMPSTTKELSLTLSPYEGWTLVKDGKNKGKLKQGRTGWLMDENGLYILQDGRRADENIIKNGKYSEKELKIGNEDSGEGLKEILGVKENFPETILNEYETKGLLERYGPHMTEVVYQAFQINRGYCLNIINNRYEWEPCTRYRYPPYVASSARPPYYTDAPECSFSVIGFDETGIPIVVTRVGKETEQKKLVIAGPHGDERNAQRLIMKAQRHFIQHGAPANTVLYFIPCISPTMAFADARGIPNEFWKDGVNGKSMLQARITDTGIFRIGFSIDKGKLTIPKLHDMLGDRYDKDTCEKVTEGGILFRDLIQDKENNGLPSNPRWGVDANRDITLSLDSSWAFAGFVKMLTSADIQRKTGKSNGSCTFFMMHGYDSTKPGNDNRGCVYGQYNVGTNDIGTIPPEIKGYIDFMTQSLYGYKNAASGNSKNDKAYFYKGIDNMAEFNGEWVRHLYGDGKDRKILAFDIELPEDYRQGTRGKGYNPFHVGNRDLPFFKDEKGFLVSEEWRIPDKNKDIEKLIFPTESFYEFLNNFYKNKGDVNKAIAIMLAQQKVGGN